MILPVKITQSSVALKVPVTAELIEGGLAVNVIDGALYTMRKNGSVIRIEGDTGNGTIASGASIALGAVMAGVVDVTGTTTITAIVLREGQTRTVRFAGALTLTNSATLVLPGGASIVTAAGDYATFRGYAAGVTQCTGYIFSPSKFALLAGSSSQNFAAATANFTKLNVTGGAAPTGLSDYISKATANIAVANSSLVLSFGYATTDNPSMQSVDTTSNARELDINPYGGAVRIGGSITSAAGFGCNGKAAQSSYSVGAAAVDLTTAIALVNKLRIMSINNGAAS